MTIAPKRRGVEAVDPARDSVEQAAPAQSEVNYDIEHGPTTADAGGVESVTDERSADPFNDERSNIERP
jgi:hypothetical protein